MNQKVDQLMALADRLSVQDLVIKYAKARDTTDAALYREIFSEDAVIASGAGKVLSNGLDAILSKVANDRVRFNPASQPGVVSYAIMRHDISNIDISLRGDAAQSDYYVNTLAYNETAKRPEIISCARNVDEYVKRNGRWWIVKSTLNFGWENEEMGKALRLGPYTPPEYRR